LVLEIDREEYVTVGVREPNGDEKEHIYQYFSLSQKITNFRYFLRLFLIVEFEI